MDEQHEQSAAPASDQKDRAAHLKEHRWQKGTSGNPGGRPKGRSLTTAVRALLDQEHKGKPLLDVLAERVVREAIAGKFQYAKEVWERLEGKTPDKVKVEGNQGVQMVVLKVPAPRVIGEPEADRQAQIEHERQIEECRKQIPPSDQPRKILIGDWWDKV